MPADAWLWTCACAGARPALCVNAGACCAQWESVGTVGSAVSPQFNTREVSAPAGAVGRLIREPRRREGTEGPVSTERFGGWWRHWLLQRTEDRDERRSPVAREADHRATKVIHVGPLQMVIDQHVSPFTNASLVRCDDHAINELWKVIAYPEQLLCRGAGIRGRNLRDDKHLDAFRFQKGNCIAGTFRGQQRAVCPRQALELAGRHGAAGARGVEVGNDAVHVEVDPGLVRVRALSHFVRLSASERVRAAPATARSGVSTFSFPVPGF